MTPSTTITNPLAPAYPGAGSLSLATGAIRAGVGAGFGSNGRGLVTVSSMSVDANPVRAA